MESSVMPLLREILKASTSAEVRLRLKRIVEGRGARQALSPPEQVRLLRVIRILEQVGGAEVERVLETLVDGIGQAGLGQEAKAARERLRTSRGAKP